jgi:hypothetical protein
MHAHKTWILGGCIAVINATCLAAEDTAALIERIKLLETRLRQVEAASAVLEVGAVELTIPVGETNASVKVPFRQPPARPVIILTGETGTAGSWVVTKSSRITERDFEINVIDHNEKAHDVPYLARIGYVVLRSDAAPAPSPAPEKTGTSGDPTANVLTWPEYRKNCGKEAQEVNEAMSEAVFRRQYAGRMVDWSGSVVAVTERDFGSGYSVIIQMQPSDALFADILITVPKALEGTVLSLNKGDKVRFSGKMMSQGGMWSYHEMNATAISKE